MKSHVGFWRMVVLLMAINSIALSAYQIHTVKVMRRTMSAELKTIERQTTVIKNQTYVIKIQQERLQRCSERREVACPMHSGL